MRKARSLLTAHSEKQIIWRPSGAHSARVRPSTPASMRALHSSSRILNTLMTPYLAQVANKYSESEDQPMPLIGESEDEDEMGDGRSMGVLTCTRPLRRHSTPRSRPGRSAGSTTRRRSTRSRATSSCPTSLPSPTATTTHTGGRWIMCRLCFRGPRGIICPRASGA